MTSSPNLQSYINGYKNAIDDCLGIIEEWEKRARETNETDVRYVMQEIGARIDDIQDKINDLARRV